MSLHRFKVSLLFRDKTNLTRSAQNNFPNANLFDSRKQFIGLLKLLIKRPFKSFSKEKAKSFIKHATISPNITTEKKCIYINTVSL